jgi:7-cyano-7-deazaguanine synthase in queuosine biosynthesis
MTRKIVISLAVMASVIANVAHTQVKKYDIKSGIVTLESVSTIGGTQIKMTRIVCFDDYGMKECQETYSNGKLKSVLFSDGKNKIALQLASKKAQNQGSTDRGIGMRVEINDMGTKKDIESGLVKKLLPMTIAGQTCEVIQVAKGSTPDIYAGWHHVMVYMKSSSSGVTTEIKAVKLEANATVPKDKFQIPAGFTVQ